MKMIEDNDVIDYTGVVYLKNDIEQSWTIRWGTVYDINQIGIATRLIVEVWSTSKIKLNFRAQLSKVRVYAENNIGQSRDQSNRYSILLKTILKCRERSDQVRCVMKTRQDINMTDRASAVYVENETELSWSIEQGVAYNENDTRH